MAEQRSLYPPFQRRKSSEQAKNRFEMDSSSSVSVVDLQSPKEHKSANAYVNSERPNINAMKLRQKKKSFNATNVGVIFKPNTFMEKNILKSEKSKRNAKKQQLLNKKKVPLLMKQQMHINKQSKKYKKKSPKGGQDPNGNSSHSASPASQGEFTDLLFPAPKRIRGMRTGAHISKKVALAANTSSPRGSLFRSLKLSSETYANGALPRNMLAVPCGKKVSSMRSNYDTLKEHGYLNPMQISSISNDNSTYVTNLNLTEYFRQSMEGRKLAKIQKHLRKKLHTLKFYRTPTPDKLQRESTKPVLLSPSASIQSLNHSMSEHERISQLNRKFGNNERLLKSPISFKDKRVHYPPRLHVVHPNNNIVAAPLNSPSSYRATNSPNQSNPFGACLQIRNVNSRGKY